MVNLDFLTRVKSIAIEPRGLVQVYAIISQLFNFDPGGPHAPSRSATVTPVNGKIIHKESSWRVIAGSASFRVTAPMPVPADVPINNPDEIVYSVNETDANIIVNTTAWAEAVQQITPTQWGCDIWPFLPINRPDLALLCGLWNTQSQAVTFANDVTGGALIGKWTVVEGFEGSTEYNYYGVIKPVGLGVTPRQIFKLDFGAAINPDIDDIGCSWEVFFTDSKHKPYPPNNDNIASDTQNGFGVQDSGTATNSRPYVFSGQQVRVMGLQDLLHNAVPPTNVKEIWPGSGPSDDGGYTANAYIAGNESRLASWQTFIPIGHKPPLH